MGTVKDIFDIIKELFKEAKELTDKTIAMLKIKKLKKNIKIKYIELSKKEW